MSLVSRSRRSDHFTVAATSSSKPRSSGRMSTGSLMSYASRPCGDVEGGVRVDDG